MKTIKHKEEEARGIGDNSETASDYINQQIDKFGLIINKVIANVLEKTLYYDLAKEHHEGARTATRVADRFRNLECLIDNIDFREEPIKLLQKFYYADKTNPLLKNHPIRKDHAIYERDIRDLENMFGKEVADYYRARVNVRS